MRKEARGKEGKWRSRACLMEQASKQAAMAVTAYSINSINSIIISSSSGPEESGLADRAATG